jgi:hypothetical protein
LAGRGGRSQRARPDRRQLRHRPGWVRAGVWPARVAAARITLARAGGARLGHHVEQQEDVDRPGRQLLTGPGERGPDGSGDAASGVGPVKPALAVGQLVSQFPQRAVGPTGGPLGGHPEGERQPSAQLGQPRGGLRVGIGRGAQQRPQQGAGVGQRQRLQHQPAGAVPDDQAGQRVPAGHHNQAGRAAGQQRADLLDRGRVVEQDQHPPPGGLGPVPGGPVVHVVGDVRRPDAQRGQEPGQRLTWCNGARSAAATQVHVQLPVREPVPDLVGPVHRQCGLARPDAAGDRRDRHRGGSASPAAGRLLPSGP